MAQSLKARACRLHVWIYAIYLACWDPRVPWYARVFALCVVAYVFSPIDLIPDFVPVLGYLDDLILVPLGIALTIKMIPSPIVEEYREKAQKMEGQGRARSWFGATIIVALWLLAAGLIVTVVVRRLSLGW